MMDEETDKQGTFGLNGRTQIVVVAALAAVLGLVLLYQYSQAGDTPPVASPAHGPGSPALATPSADASLAVLQADIKPARLAAPAEVVFITRDPFVADGQLAKLLARPDSPAPVEPAEPPKPSPEEIAQGVRAEAAKLSLRGVFGGGNDLIAFIGDRTVRTGDKAGPFEVVRIGEREVVLRKDGIEAVLRLAQPGMKPGTPPDAPVEQPAPAPQPSR